MRRLRRRYGRSGGPEHALFKQWVAARRASASRNAATHRRARAIVDKLQYQLQDMSPLGNRMVWGSEYAKARGDR